RAVIQLRRAGAAFTAVPEGVLISPMAAPAGVLRGSAPAETAAPALGQQMRFALPESRLSAELTLEGHGPERVGMALRVSGDEQPRLSMHVRELRGAGSELVARHTVQGAAPV